MNTVTPLQQEVLSAEARLRVRRALAQIEEAQSQLNSACATLSSLRYANTEWKATSKIADRVKSHWYKVRDGLEFGPRARKVALDPLATESVLKKLAQYQQVAP